MSNEIKQIRIMPMGTEEFWSKGAVDCFLGGTSTTWFHTFIGANKGGCNSGHLQRDSQITIRWCEPAVDCLSIAHVSQYRKIYWDRENVP